MRRLGFPLVLVLFLLSGATSLIDQVVWLKYLSHVFGNTTQAAAILLSVFLGGLAAGAFWWGRHAGRFRIGPVLLYGLLEGVIGLLALLSPLFFDVIDVVYVAAYRGFGEQPFLFVLLRGLLAAILLGPPTFLMGGTLPLLARGFEEEGAGRGRPSGILYSTNTWGAVAGTLAATWWLVPELGLRATLGVSAATNFAILLVVALVARRPEPSSEAALDRPAAPPPPAAGWLLLFFAIGAASLGFEVVWTRILVFYLGSSVYAFGTMLAAILIGLAAGSGIAARLLPRLGRPAHVLALLEVGIGATVLLQIALFPGEADRITAISSHLPLATSFGYGLTLLLSVAVLLLPPTLLMGAAFPIAIRLASPTGEPGEGVGRVYAANTVGAIAGSLGAGFVLIPVLGTQDSLLALGGINLACGVAAAAATAGGRSRLLAFAAAGATALALVVVGLRLPPDHVIRASGLLDGEAAELLDFREDSTAAVAVRRIEFPSGPALSIEINGVNVAGGSDDLVAIQKLQGHVPLLVHGAARDVLHIGFGSGGTAWAVSRHPVRSITIAELSPAVLDAADRSFREINHGVLDDPRVRVSIADGRNHVLATDEHPDVILSDSIHPRYAGNGSLYSLDYFRLCRERLAPGGVVSMWLPIYSLDERNLRQIVRAFAEVFPATTVWYPSRTINPFLIVLGRADDQLIDVDAFLAAWARPGIGDELAEIGYDRPEELLAEIVLAGPRLREWIGDVEPHVDDRPVVEYESGRVLSRNGSWLICFTGLLRHRTGPGPALAAASDEAQAVVRASIAIALERTPILVRHHELLLESVERGEHLQGIAANLPGAGDAS